MDGMGWVVDDCDVRQQAFFFFFFVQKYSSDMFNALMDVFLFFILFFMDTLGAFFRFVFVLPVLSGLLCLRFFLRLV